METKVVGLLDLQTGQREDNEHVARLGVSVARDFRRHGIGRALVSKAISEAKELPGCCRIQLECAPWNEAAIRLYREFGFEVEAIRRKGVNLRGTPEDDLVLALVW
jgi:putative acetyltransferase